MSKMIRTTPLPTGASAEQVFINRMRSSIYRAMSSSVLQGRSSIASKLGKTFGGKRDIYEALGYPKLNELTVNDYFAQYLRGDVAGRLIDAPVDGSWEQKPEIKDQSEGDQSEFEKGWDELVKWYSLWNIMPRADKLAGLGRFSVLLLGFDDVETKEQLKDPVGTVKELLYVQPYGEKNAEVVSWDKDPQSDRYSQPLTYKLKMASIGNNQGSSDIVVHHSRIIHIAEGLLESNTYGTPRLERVFNRLLNLELIVGGSAEMFWQGAFPGYAFIADAETDMAGSAADIENEIDMFVHDFKRYMKLQGLKVEKLSSDVADPKGHVDVQLTMISIASGIPKRILEGSERGSLASTQDESNWNDKLDTRRINYVEPVILRPFIDKMVEVGLLKKPIGDDYVIVWPDLNTPSDKEKAEVAKSRADAIRSYLQSPDAFLALSFESFLSEILEFDKDKVDRITENQKALVDGMLAREAEGNVDPDEGED